VLRGFVLEFAEKEDKRIEEIRESKEAK